MEQRLKQPPVCSGSSSAEGPSLVLFLSNTLLQAAIVLNEGQTASYPPHMPFGWRKHVLKKENSLLETTSDQLNMRPRLNIKVLDLVQPQDHMEQRARTLNCDLVGCVGLAWPRIRISPRDCLGHVSDFYFECQLFDSSTVIHLPPTMAVQLHRSSSDGSMDILSGKDAMSLVRDGLPRYLS